MSRSRTSPGGRPGWPTPDSRPSPSTAARRASSSASLLLEEREVGARARPPRGRRARVLGGATGITTTATHGRNSGTRATDLAARDGGRARRRDAAGEEHRPRRPRLARASGRAARRRAAHGGGRLPGAAELLDRVRTRGRVRRADGRAARRRRVSPYLVDELRAGDRVELRGPVGYFASSGSVARRAAAPDRRWRPASSLRSIVRHHVAVASDVPLRLLYSSRTLEDVLYRDELARFAAYDEVDIRFTLTRARPEGWRGYGRRIDRDLLAEVAWPARSTRSSTSVGRRPSSRPPRAASSSSAMPRSGSGPSGSAPREDEHDDPLRISTRSRPCRCPTRSPAARSA